MDDLLAEFVSETAESLAELDGVLLTLEQTPDDPATVSSLLRLLHTIKGTCGFLGLNRLEHVAHAAEAVLGNLRDGKLAATRDTTHAILAGLDGLKLILDGIKSDGREPFGDDTGLIAQLEAAAAGMSPHDATASVGERPVRPTAAEAGGGAQTIRVGVTLLEELMTLVGELVLTRNQLLRIGTAAPTPALVGPLQRLSQITAALQGSVMKTRMQPIGAAWNKLPRMVRDLSRELGKTIELVMLGAETELDRQVLELIRDPITHMVRNSADHGLESPTERRAYGKAETGRIALNAYHEGGHIIIEVGDDGAGLRVDRIRARALAHGLATEADLATMPEAEIHRFIFHPGFSTAPSVTSVSGRGVGMDVVKTNVERIGGTIDLRSVAGGGTHFTIKIPLTLAIISALIVAAGDVCFAIPQLSVVELVRARTQRATRHDAMDPIVERIEQTQMLRLREQLLPLVNLAELLQRPASGAAPSRYMDIVVVQIGDRRFGLIVDQIYDAEEIVVKPVAPILRQLPLFSGNTILGDGSVIMILDTNAIARMVGIGTAGMNEVHVPPPRPAAHRSADRVALLVFRAGTHRRLAVPLGLVARLENLTARQIEPSGSAWLTLYRGRLMKLLPIAAETMRAPATKRPVLVFSDAHRNAGLLVDEVIDVVDERLDIELATDQPGVLGTAIIAGEATEIIDVGYWLTCAHSDWFGARTADSGARGRVLIIDDSDFFRQLLLPSLAAHGYRVTAASSGAEALELRDAGERFEAIICDIEMPDMAGPEFARRVRGGGPWSGLPLIALTGGQRFGDGEDYRHAGFNDLVRKQDRDAVVACLRRHLEGASHDLTLAA